MSGPLGAIVATLAVFVPAGILVAVFGHFWQRLRGNPWRERFAGAIAPVVLGLIWAGIVTLAHGTLDSPVTIGLAVVAAGVLVWSKWNQSMIVLVAGVIGAIARR